MEYSADGIPLFPEMINAVLQGGIYSFSRAAFMSSNDGERNIKNE